MTVCVRGRIRVSKITYIFYDCGGPVYEATRIINNIRNGLLVSKLARKEVLHMFLGPLVKTLQAMGCRRPSWPPSWISHIAQGYPLVIHQIFVIEASGMHNPLRKKR